MEIFKGKKFSDLCKDIYTNSQTTRNQVDSLIAELRTLTKTLNDAITIVPIIQDYLTLGVKNDDQLVKLAAVVQRITTRQIASTGDPFQLSVEEKEQLIEAMGNIENENMNVSEIVNDAKEKLQ